MWCILNREFKLWFLKIAVNVPMRVLDRFFEFSQETQVSSNKDAATHIQRNDDVKRGLANLQLSHYKENQQKLLRKDISNILKIIS
jgi:hypothetical protein